MPRRHTGGRCDERSAADGRNDAMRQSNKAQQSGVSARGVRPRTARHDENVQASRFGKPFIDAYARAVTANDRRVIRQRRHEKVRSETFRSSEDIERSNELELFNTIEDQDADSRPQRGPPRSEVW